ncbi:MAG: hypothetical protein EBU88_09450 [Acidobacteria bacterium]|nr:hypothetical protein [Acidobacteriota bacterium]
MRVLVVKARGKYTAGLLLVLAGLAGWPGSSQEPQRSEMISSGRRIFAGSCGMAYCHGTDGAGGSGPRLRDREYSAEKLTRIITEGVPGSAMPAFGKGLSRVEIGQLVAFLLSVNREVPVAGAEPRAGSHFGGGEPVVARDGQASKEEGRRAQASVVGGPAGDWRAGEELFFDPANLASCRVCHTLHGRGGKVASDLTRLSGESPASILRRIVAPQPSPDGRYAVITVRLQDGGEVAGIMRDEEAGKWIRLYDTSSMPPVSRLYLQSEVVKVSRSAGLSGIAGGGCLGGNAARLTLQQLLDLVALIRTTDSSSPARVEMGEILK